MLQSLLVVLDLKGRLNYTRKPDPSIPLPITDAEIWFHRSQICTLLHHQLKQIKFICIAAIFWVCLCISHFWYSTNTTDVYYCCRFFFVVEKLVAERQALARGLTVVDFVGQIPETNMGGILSVGQFLFDFPA